jgi:RNA polymerase sigma-70 factor, ECF subfamily
VSEVSATTAEQPAEDSDIDRAREGDDAAFYRLVAPMRRELHADRTCW